MSGTFSPLRSGSLSSVFTCLSSVLQPPVAVVPFKKNARMPNLQQLSGNFKMSQIGPKHTRVAHFLFPEQNAHKLTNAQLRKQKQPCLEWAVTFSENCFQANVLGDTISVYLINISIVIKLHLSDFYLKADYLETSSSIQPMHKSLLKTPIPLKYMHVLCSHPIKSLAWTCQKFLTLKIYMNVGFITTNNGCFQLQANTYRGFKTAAAMLCTCSHFSYGNWKPHSFFFPLLAL